MHNHVIDFNADGSVEALYHDKVSLQHLGNVSMERASHVVFDELTQLWNVVPCMVKNYEYLPDVYRGWLSYATAVRFEVLVFNKARELGLLYDGGLTSSEGLDIATWCYKDLAKELADEGSEGF